MSIAFQYSKKWRFSFNPTKCKLIVFGKDKSKKRVSVTIGNHVIKRVESEPHLGMLLSNSTKLIDEYIKQRIEGCKSICYVTQSLGSYQVPVSPVTASKLYWQVCMPKLCYGFEVVPLSDTSMESLDVFHNEMAKHCQALPRQTANPGCRITLGWQSIR
ncbi:MAG: hypothetical protein GY702_15200, partial [Desulfobulbaceae bacterium]|nr:hypothetical protein [Desulfobulbaceae bacterium]